MPIPRATYRLQLHKEFGFDDAAKIAPYLARLGVSHVYASPYLKARPGSLHGYDIVAHDQLNPELGDQAAFERMVAAFQEQGLKQILDFVPNHMGVGGADNPLWLDVLEWGPESRYAGWFDIDWESDRRYLHEKLLVPFLGEQYGVELESGKLVLKFDQDNGEFAVWAYDTHKLPICPLHYSLILGDADPDLENLGDDFSALQEWKPQVVRRAGELKQALATLIAVSSDARRALHAGLVRLNAAYSTEAPRPELNALIQQQYWRATHFRVAADDINYRRFFNINDLAGLRVELPDVFEHSHQLVFRLLREGVLDGLRIDHIDGLLDPTSYLHRLRATAFADETTPHRDFYLVVEKILSHGERLRDDWPVQGTTGYEFANLVLGLLIDPKGERQLTRYYAELAGNGHTFAEVVRDSKLRIMNHEMASELNVLARDAARVARQNPRTADFTRNILYRAIRELVACFSVYRTYVNAQGAPTDDDLRYINEAMLQARRNEGEVDPSVFDFLDHLLTGELIAQPRSGFSRHTVLRCAMKLQQYSGPVMAKGLEDTAFYRYNRFIALNEVGGHPDHFGLGVAEFHAANSQRLQHWPHSMLSTATHDTKRGEDVRARLAVLSELPQGWTQHVAIWRELLGIHQHAAQRVPDANDEYLFYQTLIGTWPAELTAPHELDAAILQSYISRLKATMIKSLREAKRNSNWATPNEAYEGALLKLVERALNGENSQEFLRSFLGFQERVASLGVHNSLAQTVLKLTAPGVPDIYQGAELWNLSMVDPDNRRPVDFQQRMQALNELGDAPGNDRCAALRHYLRHWQDGRIKLAVTTQLLTLRRRHPELFASGSYEPCTAHGVNAEQLCAFVRRNASQALLVVVTRFPARREFNAAWETTGISLRADLQNRSWCELFTGRRYHPVATLPAESLLDVLPVAVLVTESAGES